MSVNFTELFSLQGKVAIVTGASRGIGFTIANGLACAGARVVGVGRSPNPMNHLDDKVRYEPCDITDAEQFEKICLQTFCKNNRVDILVNSAGISLSNDDPLQCFENFDLTINVNLRSVFTTSKIAAEYLARSGGGSIINITSIGSMLGFPDNPGYVASKGGVRMLTKALAIDYGRKNIRVNAIAPGYIRTEMTEKSYSDPILHEQRLRRMIIPRWGTPEDLVGAAVFLASEASSYITGQDIIIDGGWTAKGIS